MLAKSDLDAEEREHREWNLSECTTQLKAISDYRAAVLSCQDEPSLAEAVSTLTAAFESRAFGIDLMRGCGINRITD